MQRDRLSAAQLLVSMRRFYKKQYSMGRPMCKCFGRYVFVLTAERCSPRILQQNHGVVQSACLPP